MLTCQVDALTGREYGSYISAVRDRDSPNRNVAGFSFSMNGNEITTSSSTVAMKPIPQYAPNKNAANLLGEIGCRITGLRDGCAVASDDVEGGSGGTSSFTTVAVSPLLLSPVYGTSLGGNTITVTGSGFALADSSVEPFQMTFQDIDANVSTRRASMTGRTFVVLVVMLYDLVVFCRLCSASLTLHFCI